MVGTSLIHPAEEDPKEPALAAMAMAAVTYSRITQDAVSAPVVRAKRSATPWGAGIAESCSFSGSSPSRASGPSPAHTAAPPFPSGCAPPGWPISDRLDRGDIGRRRVWCSMDNDMAGCLAGCMANRAGSAHMSLPGMWCGHIHGDESLSSRTSFWGDVGRFSAWSLWGLDIPIRCWSPADLGRNLRIRLRHACCENLGTVSKTEMKYLNGVTGPNMLR